MSATATLTRAGPQHMRALQRANEVRLARAQLKRRVAVGETEVAEVILDCPWEADSMAVADLLVSQRNKVITKEQIAQAWQADVSDSGGPSSLEVYIHRLRRKLEGSELSIRTVRGLGYLLEQKT